MAIIHNEITINADIDKIWAMLTDLELLEKYDPTVRKSSLTSAVKSGIGAARRVTMLDGKNWFDEKVVLFKPNETLTYQLTDCSFLIAGLKHSYTFERIGNQICVRQVMEYTVKFGLLGKFLDILMIRKQSDKGVKKFFAGLKSYAEAH